MNKDPKSKNVKWLLDILTTTLTTTNDYFNIHKNKAIKQTKTWKQRNTDCWIHCADSGCIFNSNKPYKSNLISNITKKMTYFHMY